MSTQAGCTTWRAHPDVEVQVGRERSKATAKVLGPEGPRLRARVEARQ